MVYLRNFGRWAWACPVFCLLLASVLSSSQAKQSTGQSAPSHSDQTSNNASAELAAKGQTGDDGSGEVDAGVPLMSLDDVLATETAPHLVVKDSDGNPCLLATLNATMKVSYRVPEVIVHETYLAMADIQLPEDVQAQGVCGENVTHLLLHWGNGTFHVNLTFTRKEPTSQQVNATWSMTDMAVTYDLSDKRVFPGASENEEVTVEKRGLSLFSTDVGVAYVCDREITTQLGGLERGVTVKFHELEIATFGLTSDEFPNAVEYCSERDDSGTDEDILIPLIIACCLSVIVILVVIGYVISRKVQEAREQSEYRPMP
ncbi:lysosome-associated membrane glycoprotein 5 [Aplysia californica]|uniref:Lysosome-associated membrane glycoprotein 5 n=1 Tax=Aplysia californica TaxID=6500 RepID=A0ABM0ZWD4_APLCA|nr:lysosome-associated membrane glycoprotein 5 [Aplysia californica]